MKIDVLGVQITADTKNTVIFLIKKLLMEGRQIFITTPYSEMIVRAQRDKQFLDILNSSKFTLPDGAGILWAAHYLKHGGLISSLLSIIFAPKKIRDPIPEKISGSDFVWDISRLAAEFDYSIFLLGGFDDTAGLAAKRLQQKYPKLRIAGTLSPREIGDSEQITKTISDSGADFLFVALGPVRQERWIYENLPKLPLKLAIGLGGTFDYLAHKRPPAPQIWAKIGLEWLWRLITQPWRFGRISKGILGLIWYSYKARL